MIFSRTRGLPARRNPSLAAGAPRRHDRRLALEPLEDRRVLAVVINEIMYHPASEQTSEEYVELYNSGATTVNLQGWRLSGVDFDFPDVSIPAGEYLVVAADVGAFSAKYPGVANAIGGWGGRLSNQGEKLELVADSGAPADLVTYADDGDWAVRRRGPDDRGHRGWVWQTAHDGEGSSLELINAALPNEYGQNWAASLTAEGTPGAANSVASADIAPLIAETIHSPIIPTSGDSVTVVTRVVDELAAVGDVTLWHRVDDAPLAPLAMFDDGAHGDGAAGDRLYGAILPPRPDGTVVEFYISASDQGGLTRTWPAPTDEQGTQGANLLYQVLDARPGGVLPTYQVIMTETERAELESIDRFSDAQMNASFVTTVSGQTEVRYNVGVRIRGSGSRTFNPPNYRVNIPADRPWQGVTQMNLNAVNPDRQVAGSALFAIAGLPAADAVPVTVLTNGVDLMGGGYYAHVEVLNGEWAERQFPTDGAGNVYRGRRPNESPPGGQGAGLVYFGPDPAPYVSYVKTSNESEADWSDVIGLTFALNETPDATYLDDVSQVADIDQWLRTLALNALIDNNEFSLFNGDRLGDDYAMYRGVEDPRFQMVPHDLDTLFINVNRPLFRETNVPALARLVTHPDVVPRYYRQFVDLIENVITPDVLTPLLNAAIGEIVPEARIDQYRAFLLDRAQVVLSWIPTDLTVTTDLPVVDGFPRIDGMQIGTLSGQANVVDTHTVLVGGLPAAWTPWDNTWQIEVGTATGGEAVIVPTGAVWKYLDDGSDQEQQADGVAWFGHPDYDDSAWQEGPAELGYGDGDEATVVSFGDDELTKHITTYFRRSFEVVDASRFTSLRVRFLRDDGGAVYLNGEEIFRSNLAEDAAYDTVALTSSGPGVESTFFEMTVPADKLLTGTNVLAAEVHQRSGASVDVSFDLELRGFDPKLAAAGVVLEPGVNRLTVQALDTAGREIDRTSIDVWYDNGNITDLPLFINTNTTLRAADGPFRVTGETTIQAGAELRIEGGATVYFDPGTSLTVRGRLVADGNDDARIRMTREPGSGGQWNGIQLLDTAANNLLAYVDLDYGDAGGASITAVNSLLTVDNMTWGGTERTALGLIGSSWRVHNSVLPGVSSGAAIEVSGIRAGGQAVIDSNRFEPATGEGDAVRFAGASLPGPILQVLDNNFTGGEDDGVVLDGADAYFEGNTFVGYHQAVPGDNSSNAITTGTTPGTASSVTLARNVFVDNDHAVLLREGSFLVGEHNNFIGSTISAFNFDEPSLPGVTAGLGARLDGNIFHGNAAAFENYVAGVTSLEVDRSIVPTEWIDLGDGNRSEAPRFFDPQNDFRLRPGSPALGGAALGLDMGALVAAGAAVSGEPQAVTHLTTATLSIGGPGITHYRYRVNAGPFSAETAVTTPIVLNGLADGDYAVHVIGKNAAGVWQAESAATASRTWRVESGLARLVISEVLADNRTAVVHAGGFPDLIELHNSGGAKINLTGMRLSDDAARPAKFVFTDEVSLLPGQRLVVIAGAEDGAPGIHTGFALDQDGDGVFLYDQSGVLVDSVVFGLQLPDLSVARLADGRWGLARPTFGATNIAQATGDRGTLKINEWMAAGDRLFNDDFFELFNPDPLPVALAGLYLTDHPSGLPMQHEITPLSFIAGQGWRTFVADARPENGADHVGFKLSALHEMIGLMEADLTPIDVVWYTAIPADWSQARTPDGGPQLSLFRIPTPSVANEAIVDPDADPYRLSDYLRITELMYHAAAGSELDFVELQNIGDEPLKLSGVRLVDGIDYQFGDVTLAPGQFVVIVSDEAAFRARYGNAAAVAGQYAQNLSNAGERIRLRLPEPFDGDILDFTYDDQWYPTTDGDGYSLVIRVPSAAAATWNDKASWRPSGAVGGSPGFLDPPFAQPGDTNGDGAVDITDLNNVRNNFGGQGLGDATGDGRVDIDDLNAVRNHFGARVEGALGSANKGKFAQLAPAALSRFRSAVRPPRHQVSAGTDLLVAWDRALLEWLRVAPTPR